MFSEYVLLRPDFVFRLPTIPCLLAERKDQLFSTTKNKMSGITKLKEYPDGYSEDAMKVLNTMSFSSGKDVKILGSMSLRSQVYAGDYDAYETVVTHGSKSDALRTLVKTFKKIIKETQQIPNTFIGDIKSGSIEEWKIIGEPFNYEASIQKLEELYEDKIISKEMFEEGKKKIKPHPTKLERLALQREFRPNVLRWTTKEVLLGFKRLQDGRKFKLEEAFETPIITKLDVVSWVQNNRFTDFSMIYEFKHNSTSLNKEITNIEESLRKNIFVLFHEKNYFKMAKRMFSLAKLKKYQNVLEILSPLFNGDAGRLYMVYGDIGTLESLLENHETVSESKLDFEIDQFKQRLSNITFEKYISKEHEIFRLIDSIVDTKHSRDSLLKQLNTLKQILSELMSAYAKQYLLKHKVMPIY